MNVLHTVIQRNANWIGHTLHRNRLRKRVTEGKVQMKRKRGRRRKQLPDGLEETRICLKFKGEAPDGTLWRGYGPAVGPSIL